jgi:predicted component of viral defense system (DUF524 family)
MPEPIFTIHARDMLKEREILEQWVLNAISMPDEKSIESDGNMHYFKSLLERENRILHVVVNEGVEPNRIVTLFLDRRRRTK